MVTLSACALVCFMAGANNVVLLEFTADWCGACRSVEPTVQRLTDEGYPVQRVAIDRERDAAAQFRVTSVPCFVLLVDGKEADRVVGAASYARLTQMFARVGLQPSGSASNVPQEVRGQSPEFGLPRPLADFARGFSNQGRSPAPRELAASNTNLPATMAPSAAVSMAPAGPVAMAPVGAQPFGTPQPSHEMSLAPAHVDPAIVQLASQATVRLRVEDGKAHSVATGTIIDTHGEEALVVTCGHVFRDSQGKGPITVDVFANGQARTVAGTLISYDLERDIALVAMVPGVKIQPAPVGPPSYQFARGQAVFSLGCDKGADPSVRVSSITAIDRYVGSPNLEVAGMPVDGRSGGGLFSSEGYLIGLCNAADPQDQEGIFASLPVIHWELDKVGQRRIYEPRPQTQLAAAQPPAATRPLPDMIAPVSAAATAISQEIPVRNVSLDSNSSTGPDTEVICIVRSRSNPQGTERLVVLDRPSRQLLEMLATESQARSPGAPAQARATPVIRAQSDR